MRFFQKHAPLLNMCTRKFLNEPYRRKVSHRAREVDATSAVDCRSFTVKLLGRRKVTAEKFNQSSHLQYLRIVLIFGLRLLAFLARAVVIAAKQRKPAQT